MDLNDLYADLILEEIKHPQNQGVLPSADISVSEGVASCGDVATIYLKIEAGKIKQLTWKAEGCAISRAGLSRLSVLVQNRSIADVEKWTVSDMLSVMQLKQISPGREQCLLLGLRALQRALTQLSSNQKHK